MPEHVYAHYGSLLYLVHRGLLVEQPGGHEVGSLEHELDGSLVGGEAGVHLGVGVDCFEGRDAVLVYVDEVQLLIDNYVLGLVIVPSLQFIDDDFPFFGEDELELFLVEVGPLEEAVPEFLDG